MLNVDKNTWGINHQQARFILEELVRNGVDTFVVSTGSRNTALMVALADFEGITLLTHPDERGAAFYALGYGRAKRKPAALISTSGTAAANYYPAVIEASMAQIPLVVLTADRPIENRDARTDQVIDQVNLYSTYLRWGFDIQAADEQIRPEYILTAVDQAVYRATNNPAGPVHLNCCFRKPHLTDPEDKAWYQPTPAIEQWKAKNSPYTSYCETETNPAEAALGSIKDTIGNAKRGLIVCGGLPASGEHERVRALAETLGWPVFADITSSVRFGVSDTEASPVIAQYEVLLRDKSFAEKLKPDVVLHFGGGMVNESVQQYLAELDATYLLVNDNPFRQDPTRIVDVRVNSCPFEFAGRLATGVVENRSSLLEPLQKANHLAELTLCELKSSECLYSEWQLVQEIIGEIDAESGLFIGNSLPVREMDRFAFLSKKKIFTSCNRGVSGIDGNLATAAGFAKGLGRATTLYTGDVAALHDINSLLLLKRSDVPVTVVVPNNDGGGVFSFLPTVTKTPQFEKLFTAPHGLCFKAAAELFDIPYYEADSPASFREVYRKALSLGCASFVEVRVEREQNVKEQQDIFEKVGNAVIKAEVFGAA